MKHVLLKCGARRLPFAADVITAVSGGRQTVVAKDSQPISNGQRQLLSEVEVLDSHNASRRSVVL